MQLSIWIGISSHIMSVYISVVAPQSLTCLFFYKVSRERTSICRNRSQFPTPHFKSHRHPHLTNLKGGPWWKATSMSSPPVAILKGRCDRKEMEFTCQDTDGPNTLSARMTGDNIESLSESVPWQLCLLGVPCNLSCFATCVPNHGRSSHFFAISARNQSLETVEYTLFSTASQWKEKQSGYNHHYMWLLHRMGTLF